MFLLTFSYLLLFFITFIFYASLFHDWNYSFDSFLSLFFSFLSPDFDSFTTFFFIFNFFLFSQSFVFFFAFSYKTKKHFDRIRCFPFIIFLFFVQINEYITQLSTILLENKNYLNQVRCLVCIYRLLCFFFLDITFEFQTKL